MFLSGGWVGAIIGLVGIIVGFLLYRASRVGSRPVFQVRTMRLIGGREQSLPEEVEIFFKGRSVPRLSKTYVVLWNSGNATLNGEDIVTDDVLRFEFNQNAEVLTVGIPKRTREANKFRAAIDATSRNNVGYAFDFLDPGDGAVMELLHTDQKYSPKMKGTIRGVPKGVLDWGRVFPVQILDIPFLSKIVNVSLRLDPKGLFRLALFSGTVVLVMGLIILLIPAVSDSMTKDVGWVLIGVGAIYILLMAVVLWTVARRQPPKSLVLEDIGD